MPLPYYVPFKINFLFLLMRCDFYFGHDRPILNTPKFISTKSITLLSYMHKKFIHKSFLYAFAYLAISFQMRFLHDFFFFNLQKSSPFGVRMNFTLLNMDSSKIVHFMFQYMAVQFLRFSYNVPSCFCVSQ